MNTQNIRRLLFSPSVQFVSLGDELCKLRGKRQMLLFRRCWVSFDTVLEIVENVFELLSSKCVILWNLIYPENSGFKGGLTASAVLKYSP